MAYRKKLIEVALPLDAISDESSLRKRKAPAGYPTTIHKWWAQRPIAACRAVLFASLVDDPADPAEPPAYLEALDRLPRPDLLPAGWDAMDQAEQRRERLFAFIARLVKWEASTDEQILGTARALINLACEGHPPPVLDPFCGGGSIPLEAQRLGLEAHASDLNPVAVLITKALIEIPPKFAGRPPVNPEDRKKLGGAGAWKGAAGLAADVRYYGRWMRDEAERRIGHLYPKAKLPDGTEATVIAWLWARTVKCPNPACGARMPLVRSFALSTKPGKQAWVEPIVDHAANTVRFEVKTGMGKPPEGTKQRGRSICLFCDTNLTDAILRDQATRFGLGTQLMAVVAEGNRGRIYLNADSVPEVQVEPPNVAWLEQPMPGNPRWFSPPGYGLPTFADLFTPRQLVALSTFSDLVGEARARVRRDAVAAGLPDDATSLAEGGTGAQAYADAAAVGLAFALSRAADYGSTLASWRPKDSAMRSTLAKQALPLVWDYAEGSFFGKSSSGFVECANVVAKCLDFANAGRPASIRQADATQADLATAPAMVSTDPPYYDNIGYADLADFFYVWLRRSLRDVLPTLFETVLTPKAAELVATPYRFEGSQDKARSFFQQGLGAAFVRMRHQQHPDFPLTVYYAFKQKAEAEDDGADESVHVASGMNEREVSTGWETMLNGLIGAGFQITGTWPLRTEGDNRQVASGTNALASSIVLVCRPRPNNAPTQERRVFLEELTAAMREELPVLSSGKVAPVDLAQASIGPGMAVYSRYSKVERLDGKPVTVREALADINNAIASYRAERVRAFDRVTQFCIDWYTQYGWAEATYGNADGMARAYNVAPNAMDRDGLIVAEKGKVRLERPESYPLGVAGLGERDFRGSAWEACLRLAQTLAKEGEQPAAALARQLGDGVSARARELAVWLYTIADAKKRADDAFLFNALDASWSAIQEHIARMSEGQQARF